MISAIVITKNEAANLGRCLRSLHWVDEIVVVDSGSSDETVQIAKSFPNVKVHHSAWLGYAATKNLAIDLTRNDWVLWLDADETLDEQAKMNIEAALPPQNAAVAGFSFARKTYFLGQWIRFSGWYPGRVLRLFDKRRARINANLVHEGVEWITAPQMEFGPNAKPTLPSSMILEGHIHHHSYPTLSLYFQKMNGYGELAAQSCIEKKKRFSLFYLFLRPFFTFFKFYFFKQGFRDGARGFIIAIGSSFSNFIKYSHFWSKSHSLDGKRVIVSRTDGIGDVVLTLPLVKFLKLTWPNIKILFLGTAYTRDVIALSEYVDEIYEWPATGAALDLKALNADAILHIFPNKKVALAAKRAKIQTRIGTGHRFYHWFTCNRLVFFSRKNSSLHEAQLNFKLLSPFMFDTEIELDGLRVDFLHRTFESRNLGPPIEFFPKKIILHPKSKGSGREWPLTHFLRLAQILTQRKMQVFITGTQSEGVQILSQCPELLTLTGVTDLTGKLSLDELVKFIEDADALVAASTGPLHIAAALEKSAIGIYPTLRPVDPGRWAPLGQNAKVKTFKPDCNECKGQLQCPCMQKITPESIAELI